jgi:hypothetical protein
MKIISDLWLSQVLISGRIKDQTITSDSIEQPPKKRNWTIEKIKMG